jgi:hypothetical protein
MIVLVGNNECTDRMVKGLELMSWLGEVKKKPSGLVRKSYVPGEIASTVARTGSRRPLKGADSAGDQG